MKKRSLFSTAWIASALLCLSSQVAAQQTTAGSNSPIGIVNFKKCIEDSKLGKAQQAAFENLKNQMATILDKTEKDLEEIANKLNDPDQVDALSPEAEEDLKNNFQRLSIELNRYQNQYYQILNQANYKVLNELSTKVAEASETVSKAKSLKVVFNEEACFYYDPALDITKLVVIEMDKNYVPETKPGQPQQPQPPAGTGKTPPQPTAPQQYPGR